MKIELSQEFVVGGYTLPRGSRVGLGALLIGVHQGSDLVFSGKVGTGLDNEMLLRTRHQLDAAALPTSPFTVAEGLPRKDVHWCRPELVVQVSFLQWMESGKLRHPRLVAVRSDKDPREVVRES